MTTILPNSKNIIMDESKLNAWIKSFQAGIEKLQIEYDAFFLKEKLQDFYNLRVDRENQHLILEMVNHDNLPKEIESQILKIYETSRPED
ncbi:MAG: hypothetical protein ABI594_21660 [Ginsengibacter sp.]